MLVRQAQVAAMVEAAISEYVDRVAAHLRRCFPDETQRLSAALPLFIRDGIARARNYGFTSERDICNFIDLRLLFGPDFESDAWAKRGLNDLNVKDPTARMDCLYEAARQSLAEHSTDV